MTTLFADLSSPVHETKKGAHSGTRNNKPKVSQSSERMTYHLSACATPKRDYSHCTRRDDSTDSVTLHLGLFPLAFSYSSTCLR